MKLKPDDIPKIIEMRERGATLREISIKFGISKRRVCQILKDKRLRKPGRKPVAIDEDVKNLILRLRRRGYSIDRIHGYLLSKEIHVSRYRIWKTIKEHELFKRGFLLQKFLQEWELVVVILLLNLKILETTYKLLVAIEIPSCRVVSYRLKRSVRLNDVIEILDRDLSPRAPKRTLLLLSRVPPLVPTRSCTNRLIKHIKNMRWEYRWIPTKELRHIRNTLIKTIMDELQGKMISTEDIHSWFSNEGTKLIEVKCHEYLDDICNKLGGDGNGIVGQVKGHPETGK